MIENKLPKIAHSLLFIPARFLMAVIFVCLTLNDGEAQTIEKQLSSMEINGKPAGITESYALMKNTEIIPRVGKSTSDESLRLESKLSQVLSSEIDKRFLLNAVPKSGEEESIISASPLLRTNKDNVQVYIEVEEINDSTLAQLAQLGFQLEVSNAEFKMLQGWVQFSMLADISEMPEVRFVSYPKYATFKNTGVVTEGDRISKSNLLRDRGFSGKGVRIGILSDGANALQDSVASRNLPIDVTIYGSCRIGVNNPNQCRSAGTCNEGTAMAEIIHDIAPEADIAIAAVGTTIEFVNALDTLVNEFRADIIVDDIGFFGEPYFEDGMVAQAVTSLPSRILYVSAAGNSANTHYKADFFSFQQIRGSDQIFHDFDNSPRGVFAGVEELFHGFIVPPRSGVTVIVQWDARERFPGFQDDYALQGYDSNNIVAVSDIDNNATQESIEAVCVPNNSDEPMTGFVTFTIERGNSPFKMYFLGALAIEHPIPRGSIFGHPSVKRAIAVGTVNANEPNNDEIAFYSSLGPSDFNIREPGQQTGVLPRPRRKPDLVSIDGISVSGAGGFSSLFFGTSAAAPHVAGVAAQLMSVSPLVTARGVSEALKKGAVDLGTPGFDFTYGYGRMDAAMALENLARRSIAPTIMLLLDDE